MSTYMVNNTNKIATLIKDAPKVKANTRATAMEKNIKYIILLAVFSVAYCFSLQLGHIFPALTVNIFFSASV